MKKRRIRFLPEDTIHEVHVDAENPSDVGTKTVEIQKPRVSAEVVSAAGGGLSVLTQDGSYEVFVRQEHDVLYVQIAGESFQFTRGDVVAAGAGPGRAGPTEVKAPMPGKVVKLLRSAGETVASGQGVLLFEAMKMQNEIRAPFAGVLSSMDVEEGQAVETHEKLFAMEPSVRSAGTADNTKPTI